MSHPARGPSNSFEGIDGKANAAGHRNDEMSIKLTRAEVAA
jgi:hypothetical protein